MTSLVPCNKASLMGMGQYCTGGPPWPPLFRINPAALEGAAKETVQDWLFAYEP